MVEQNDISILIPTYQYRDRVGAAVASALASGAGEIIVVDDRSSDGTMELLASYVDPRLSVYENGANLGLWENHLRALSLATKPWIKFLQADDLLLPDGLATIAAAADHDVSVVWSNPRFVQQAGPDFDLYSLATPRRLRPAEMLTLLKRYGWVLGSPSMVLLRRDCIEADPAIWRTDVSVDLVIGTIAASRGDTVLLPVGTMLAVCHPGQDARQQGLELACERAKQSAEVLRARPEPAVREHGACLAITSFVIWSRGLAAQLWRGRAPTRRTWRSWLSLVSTLTIQDLRAIWSNGPSIVHGIGHAWWGRRPTPLDRSEATTR